MQLRPDESERQEESYASDGGGHVAQKSGLAIASVVVGIVSIAACGLFGLGSITGLVLGIVALVKARKAPLRYGGQGFAIAGIVLSMVSFLYIGIVYSITIPNLMALYYPSDEASAIRNLKLVVYAESIFQCSSENRKYGTLKELAAEGLIDTSLADGMEKNYIFEIKTDGMEYEITATPVKDSEIKGRSFYYSSKEHFVRAALKGGLPATVLDTPLNKDNSRLYTDF